MKTSLRMERPRLKTKLNPPREEEEGLAPIKERRNNLTKERFNVSMGPTWFGDVSHVNFNQSKRVLKNVLTFFQLLNVVVKVLLMF